MSTPLLFKQTLTYGISNILGRLLNWLLVPFYTHIFTDTAHNGIINNLYGWAAFLLIVLTYGMETTYFRFVNKKEVNPTTVYSTIIISLITTSLLFIGIVWLFITPISKWLHYEQTPQYIIIFATILGIDALSSILFAHLRHRNKAIKFALLKFFNILLNIALNIYFLIILKQIDVIYVFLSNLIASAATLLLLLPIIKFSHTPFHLPLFKKMLRYSLPLLIIGIAGLVPQSGYAILLRYLLPVEQADRMLGVFAPCFKLGVIMALFTQAFRYAFEPYFFSQKNEKEQTKQLYAKLLNYFVILGIFILLTVSINIDTVIQILGENYRTETDVIPYILVGFLIMGMNYSLSLWYKITDKTYYGARLNVIGTFVYLITFFMTIHSMGTIGIGIAFCLSQIAIFILSYIWSRRHYAVPYRLSEVWGYIITALLAILSLSTIQPPPLLSLLITAALISLFGYLFLRLNRDALPLMKQIIKKREKS